MRRVSAMIIASQRYSGEIPLPTVIREQVWVQKLDSTAEIFENILHRILTASDFLIPWEVCWHLTTCNSKPFFFTLKNFLQHGVSEKVMAEFF